MNATQYTPAQLDALRNSFINAITSNAPAGVNIKIAVKRDGVINVHIMNAPAELYDFSAYTTCTRCVKVDNEALKANAALSDIWAHLGAVAKEWSTANNGATLSTAVYIGSPSKSFAPVAKDTRAPRQKAAAVEVSPAPVVENIPAEVEAEPSPVVEAAPVRRRLGAGRLVARLLVAFLSVIIAALRVLVAVVRLAERGRPWSCVAIVEAGQEIGRRGVARVHHTRVYIARRALGVRLMAKYRAEVIRQRVAERVAMIRARVVAGGVDVRGCIVAAVEAGQMIASRAGVRVAHGVNVAAWVLIVAARRAEAAAEYINNI